MAVQDVRPGARRTETGLLLATYLVLAATGVVLGVLEAFLVPQRVFGGVEGLSAVLAFVGNAVVGSVGGVGTRTTAGAVVPVASWFVTVGCLTAIAPGGDVVIPGKLPVDPGVVVTGMAFLILGLIAGAISLVVTVRYTRRANPPTSLT